jgi:predicted MPP superfamily phosphohydrolase
MMRAKRASWIPVALVALAVVVAAPAASATGPWFSDELFAPRMGQPVLREAGESFTSYVGVSGSYSVEDVTADLAGLDGTTLPLTVVSVTERSLTAGSDLDVMLFADGLAALEEIVLEVPEDTPAGFYGFEVDLAGTSYASVSAVRIYDSYPGSWGFIQITDTHVGYTAGDDTSLERLEFFVREANFLNPELVVVTGDLCENMNEGHDWPEQFLGAVAELRVPVYVIPGNHDYYNDGESYDSGGPMRYFHEINRFENSLVTLGSARFYGVTTQYDEGLFHLYRCHGPSTDALNWVASDVGTLGPSDHPRFLLMHGPNYDRLVWNTTNTAAVRDLLDDGEFDLALAGHTHRFETFLNSGTNSIGRDDFSSDDDWGSDVSFPGYPLHLQTSALGKDSGEALALADSLEAMSLERAAAHGIDDPRGLAAEIRAAEPAQRGPLGETIAWRWIQVDGADVSFFTADTDGDGYRNTEEPWMLGEITFSVETDTAGVVTSNVENDHHETWHHVRHYVPTDPGTDYDVEGGTLVNRFSDGIAVVAVDSVGPVSASTVVLTPRDTGAAGAALALRLLPGSPNPFNPETVITFDLPAAGDVLLAVYSADGRRVATLVDRQCGQGRHAAVWRGRDDTGAEVASGVYFVRLSACGREARERIALVK